MKQPISPERACQLYAAENHSVISGAVARGFGMTDRQIACRVEKGLWKRVYRDLYLVGSAPPSWRQDVALACSSGAVASHRCAGALYGLQGCPPREIEILTDKPRPVRFGAEVIVHQTNHLPHYEIATHGGIPVTTVPRTLLDLGGVAGYKKLRRAAIDAVSRDLIVPDQLEAQLSCCGVRGRPGTRSLRRLLATMDWSSGMSDSDLEDLAFGIIVEEGFPTPLRLHELYSQSVLVAEFDLAYPQAMLGIEVDSWAFHSSKPDFVRDRRRWNEIVASGWRVLHFVYEDSVRPRQFLNALGRTLKI